MAPPPFPDRGVVGGRDADGEGGPCCVIEGLVRGDSGISREEEDEGESAFSGLSRSSAVGGF